ncbi:MAG: MFS transporter [Acidimicrobiales bacterium]
MSRAQPRPLFLRLSAVATFTSTLGFATVTLYRFLEAGLSPFQLVIVGTAMEASVFLAEIPTGVVADVISRRTSIVIGHLGMGIGMMLEGALPSFWPILIAQVFWGISYTFTSGATQAWLAGEVGEDAFADTLLAGRQLGYPAAAVGLIVSFGLGVFDLQAPLLIAGAIGVGVGLWLAFRMPETGFETVPRGEREHWASMVNTTRTGVRAIANRRALVFVVIAIVAWGAASEAFDRLGQPHLIEGIGLPQTGQTAEVVWIGLLSACSLVIGFSTTSWARKRRVTDDRKRTMRWVVVLAIGECLTTLVLAVSGLFAFAAAAYLAVRATRSLRGTLLNAWVLPMTPRATRATALSVLGQADAAGQSLVGPGLGWLGSAVSLPAAMLASAGLLSVTPALAGAAGRADPTGEKRGGEPAEGAVRPD